MKQARTLVLCAAIALVLGTSVLAGGIKVETKHDKTFNFEGLKTYAWRLDGANPVHLLQSTDHDPEQIRKNVEPTILATFDQAFAKKGLKRVAEGEPDFYVDYYVLIGPNISSQYHGQFVGAIPEWGLPDFAMSTSALKIVVQGSLIVDLVAVKQKMIVWRGLAEAELDKPPRPPAERVTVMNDIAKRMLDKFPPKYQPPKS
jgi:hypothetical protein